MESGEWVKKGVRMNVEVLDACASVCGFSSGVRGGSGFNFWSDDCRFGVGDLGLGLRASGTLCTMEVLEDCEGRCAKAGRSWL